MSNQRFTEEVQPYDSVAESLRFLQEVMPGEGYTFIEVWLEGDEKEKTPKRYPIKTPKEGVEIVAKYHGQKVGIFFSVAAYKERYVTLTDPATGQTKRKFREDDNWSCSKIIGVDIDCGSTRSYTDQKEAAKALAPHLTWLAETHQIPYRLLVNSGGGLHIYFVFAEPIRDLELWRRVSSKMVNLLSSRGLKVDNTASKNAKGLLRVAGFPNNKLDVPRGVKVKKLTGAPIPLEGFEAKLDKALVELGVVQDKVEPTQNTQPESSRNSSHSPKPQLASVLKECPAMREIVADPNHEYPEWLAVINVARHCEDHDTAIHEVSKAHRNYNPEETEIKAATFTGGPTRCTTFEGLNAKTKAACEGCQHRKDKRVNTPNFAAVIVESEATGSNKAKGSAALQNLPFATINVDGKFRFIDCAKTKQNGINSIELMSKEDARPIFVRTLRERGFSEKDAAEIFYSWISDPDTKHFNGITFDPLDRDKDALNLWQGPAIEPNPNGTYDTLNSFIREVICAGSDKLHGYVMNWLAHAVQKPEEKPGVMVWLVSGQGVGKGTFFKLIREIWRHTTLQVTTPKHLFNNFNAQLEAAYFVLFDEALFAGSGETADQLKGLITEPYLQVSQKFQPVRTTRSLHRLMAASNHTHAAIADRDDRRGLFLRVSEVRKGDHAYFTDLNTAIKNESPALLAHLIKRDISEFNPARDKPNTDEGLRQKIASLKGIARVICDLLHQGAIPNAVDEMEEWTGATEVRTKDLETRARELGIRNPDSKDIKEAMKTYMPKAYRAERIGTGLCKARGYKLPELETARGDFIRALGGGAYDWE